MIEGPSKNKGSTNQTNRPAETKEEAEEESKEEINDTEYYEENDEGDPVTGLKFEEEIDQETSIWKILPSPGIKPAVIK
ncbi:11257_t:CDS:2 [Gigaspora rosea]|nr:11257_t:CDS:2 [Gigaspora rosea]